jgi:hypothetical protein
MPASRESLQLVVELMRSADNQGVHLPPVRVATYTRISTDEEHQPYSLEAQADRLEKYIASQDGWGLARRYSHQCSGATLERPELKRALGDAELSRYDLLLVYRVDRLPDPSAGWPTSWRAWTRPRSPSAPPPSPSTPRPRQVE